MREVATAATATSHTPCGPDCRSCLKERQSGVSVPWSGSNRRRPFQTSGSQPSPLGRTRSSATPRSARRCGSPSDPSRTTRTRRRPLSLIAPCTGTGTSSARGTRGTGRHRRRELLRPPLLSGQPVARESPGRVRLYLCSPGCTPSPVRASPVRRHRAASLWPGSAHREPTAGFRSCLKQRPRCLYSAPPFPFSVARRAQP
jgi:hypothetical protein